MIINRNRACRGIYGAEWAGTSSTAWRRTDDAASFPAPVPYAGGMQSGYGSPFDGIMPWAGMQVVEDAEAGTLVSVPKFWYRLTGGNGAPLKIQIANRAASGFSVSPMHMDRGDGKGERGIAFIGRYKGATDYKSRSGAAPKYSLTRATARSGIHALGNSVWQCDFAARFTLWLLYLVEYADWGTQWVIGAGCSNGSRRSTGYTDGMPYHTGTNLTDKRAFGCGTQYRHIEGLWDNLYEWLDGCYYTSGGLNIIKNPAAFSDGSGGALAGKPVIGYAYPSKMKISADGGYPLFYPTEENGSGEATSGGRISGQGTYVPDVWYYDGTNTTPCIFAGGGYTGYTSAGLFAIRFASLTEAGDHLGCRLQKLP